MRAALNPILATRRTHEVALPDDANIAKVFVPGQNGFSTQKAYQLLVAGGEAAAQPSLQQIKQALIDDIDGGSVAGIPSAQLEDPATRLKAYADLAQAGLVPAQISQSEIDATVSNFSFFDQYLAPDPRITAVAQAALKAISYRVSLSNTIDILVDVISLASIYFLEAIGLAITFGVMGVINMAHGKFIMTGAYMGYVLQQIVPDETLLILLAVPTAFAATFCADVLMERLVVQWLYNRPLEMLLATFGISIALQQLAKNIFGTQARPLTSPDWLGGGAG